MAVAQNAFEERDRFLFLWCDLVLSSPWAFTSQPYVQTGAECSPENCFTHEALCLLFLRSEPVDASVSLVQQVPELFLQNCFLAPALVEGNFKGDFFRGMLWCKISASCIEENMWIFYAYTWIHARVESFTVCPTTKSYQESRRQHSHVCWPSAPGQCDETPFPLVFHHVRTLDLYKGSGDQQQCKSGFATISK